MRSGPWARAGKMRGRICPLALALCASLHCMLVPASEVPAAAAAAASALPTTPPLDQAKAQQCITASCMGKAQGCLGFPQCDSILLKLASPTSAEPCRVRPSVTAAPVDGS